MSRAPYLTAPSWFQVARASLFCRFWARKRGLRYHKMKCFERGVITLPTGQKFSFSLWQQRDLSDLPGLGRQLTYQLRHAKMETRQ